MSQEAGKGAEPLNTNKPAPPPNKIPKMAYVTEVVQSINKPIRSQSEGASPRGKNTNTNTNRPSPGQTQGQGQGPGQGQNPNQNQIQNQSQSQNSGQNKIQNQNQNQNQAKAKLKVPSKELIHDLGLQIRHGDSASPGLELEEFVGNKIEMIKRTQAVYRKAALLGGFVPDYILNDEFLQVPSLRKFEAVVFMTDISGFTALTEEYSLKGKGGTDQLTKTLAAYMGPLAECILRTGGDIIKFAGDAFLSVWEVKNPSEFPELVQQVCDTALYCQEKYGQYVTDVGITIKVKIGIGAGVCYAAGLGDNQYNHYAVFGPGVKAASDGEHECLSGDIVLHASAWKYCEAKHFSYLEKDGAFVKILDILHFINPTKRGRPIVVQRLIKDRGTSNAYNDVVRPYLDQSITAQAEERLKKYVIPPVLKKLEDEIPLDYLNESRMVTIVFIHVDYKPFEANSAGAYQNLAEIVQIAFIEVLKEVRKLNGCLTKIIMFDKGLTYLVVFGLPGFSQDNQTSSALNFAYKIKPVLSSIRNVKETSIGVTTGSTYCGILGHPRRHEYTVIGKKVNRAARLMIYYPGKVTCEQETFYNSKLPAHYFMQLEAKALKGISNVGKIYEFLSSDVGDPDAIRRYEFPMLGRKAEFNLIRDTIQACRKEFEKMIDVGPMAVHPYDTRSATDMTSSGAWMIVIEGENGIGKSRLLSAVMQDAEKSGLKLFSVILNQQHSSSSPLFAVKSLMMQAFNMEGLRNAQEREEHIRKMAASSGDPDIIQGICTLNDLLHFKLPVPQKIAYADAKTRHAFAQHTLVQLIKLFHPKSMLLLCVEDAHFMQQSSWEYLNFISRLPSVVTLMTLRRNSDGTPKLPEVAYKICYHSPHVKTIQLSGLESQYMLPLACQLMEVKGIPADLEKILVTKSVGNPSWVENILNDLLNSEKIKIVDQMQDDTSKIPKRNKIVMVNPKFIKRQDTAVIGSNPVNTFDDEFYDMDLSKNALDPSTYLRTRVNPERRLCLIKSNTNISTENVSGSIKEMILDTFDTLSPNDQMVVKCACVLGGRFSHCMLNRLLPMYGRDAKKYMASFRRLMEDRIIRCASAPRLKRGQHKSLTKMRHQEVVHCFCPRYSGGGNGDYFDIDLAAMDLPNYCYCRYSEFTKEAMVDVIYELMTEDLKKELHLKAAKYLETTAVMCVSCGGEATTFVYGFDLQDLAAAENQDEAIAVAGSRKRNSGAKFRKPTPETSLKSLSASMKIRAKRSSSGSKTDITKEQGTKPKTMATQLHGFRRSLGNGSSGGQGQIASIELDILKSLFEYEQRRNSGLSQRLLRCFKCKSNLLEQELKDALSDENASGTNINDRGDIGKSGNLVTERTPPPALSPSPNPSPGHGVDRDRDWELNYKDLDHPLSPVKTKPAKLSITAKNTNDKKTDSKNPTQRTEKDGDYKTTKVKKPGENRKMSQSATEKLRRISDKENEKWADEEEEEIEVENTLENYDLRDCQCAIIQARICMELITHYKKAEKYGKCLYNLLDAAESIISIGNAVQAMAYLEEAENLIEGFNNGTIPEPKLDDPDDVVLIDKETSMQMSFLSGLAYFEMGASAKAKSFFIEALKQMGTNLPMEDNNRKIKMAINSATYTLWTKYHAPACCRNQTKFKKGDKKAQMFGMKIRILSYLQKLYRLENKINLALLVSLIQTATAEELGGYMHDEIPAYCNMMEMMTFVCKHEKAKYYEEKSLNLIRQNLGAEEQVDPLGLLTSANLFLALAWMRYIRGELKTSIEAGYLSLRVSKVLHDDTLAIHVYPVLITSLMFCLRISEIMEAMQNLWYTSQAQENWSGMATYFHLGMELILELCCPIESFYYCEAFVTGKDWNEDVVLFREFEIQFSFETSLALWYTRLGKWDEAKTWRNLAETHKPVSVSVRSVSGTLKLLQCYLISANFHQTKKRYQLFANDKSRAKDLMKELKKDIEILPIYQSRYYHLVAYYCKILDRKNDSNKNLVKATEIAKSQGNRLEEEFITHTKMVWSEMCPPNISFYWLENSEQKNNNIDWHAPSKIPWHNIMYSLPVPAWS